MHIGGCCCDFCIPVSNVILLYIQVGIYTCALYLPKYNIFIVIRILQYTMLLNSSIIIPNEKI